MKSFSLFIIMLFFVGCSGINQKPIVDPPDAALTAKSPAKHLVKKGHLSLSWDAAEGATWYNLYYSTKPGVIKSNSIKVSKIKTTSYTVTGLAMDTIYFFVVTAANANTESDESYEVSGKPKPGKSGDKKSQSSNIPQ